MTEASVRNRLFDTTEFSSGGGLPDNFDGVVEKSRFTLSTFNGKQDPVNVLKWWIRPHDVEALGEQAEHLDDGMVVALYSQGKGYGSPENWLPCDEDGETIDPDDAGDEEACEGVSLSAVTAGSRQSKNSNYSFLMGALAEAGYQMSSVEDATSFEGLSAHFARRPRSDLKFEQDAPEDGEKRRAPEVLVPAEILGTGLGGGKKAAGKKGKVGKGSSTQAGEDDFISRVSDQLCDAIGLGGELSRADARSAVSGKFTGKERAGVMKLFNNTKEFSALIDSLGISMDDEGMLTLG